MVIAIAVAVVITSLQVTHMRELETRNEIQFVHLDAVAELSELTREARTLRQRVLDRLASVTTDWSGAAGIQSTQIGYIGVLESMQSRLTLLAALDEEYDEQVFVLNATRLRHRFSDIEHALRQSRLSRDIITSIDVLSNTIEQHIRLHQIAIDRHLNELAERQRNRPQFLAFLVLFIGLSGLATMYLIRSLGAALRRQEAAERALADSQERLHHVQKLDALGGLAGGIAHDFNNWLTVILGHVSLMRDTKQDPEDINNGLNQINEAGLQAASLTKQLLSFSRRQQIQPQVLNLNVLIKDMEEVLLRVMGADIELTFEYAPDLYDVELDPDQVQQVILNLVNNARDAMPTGGVLSVKTSEITVSPGSVGSAGVPEGDYSVLSVTDTGIGMDDDTRRRLFEPFFTTKDRGHGTGLGLSMVHGVVMASNGHIFVESREGKGSKFTIYFPRAEKAATDAHDTPAQESPRGGNETILVVEDNDQVRQFAESSLKSLGYEVLSAPGGPEGLEICKTESTTIDLILSDVVMPGMSGPQFMAEALKIRPDVAAIYMSAYAKDKVLRIQGESDTRDIPLITKPFSIESLSHYIREQLAKRTKI